MKKYVLSIAAIMSIAFNLQAQSNFQSIAPLSGVPNYLTTQSLLLSTTNQDVISLGGTSFSKNLFGQNATLVKQNILSKTIAFHNEYIFSNPTNGNQYKSYFESGVENTNGNVAIVGNVDNDNFLLFAEINSANGSAIQAKKVELFGVTNISRVTPIKLLFDANTGNYICVYKHYIEHHVPNTNPSVIFIWNKFGVMILDPNFNVIDCKTYTKSRPPSSPIFSDELLFPHDALIFNNSISGFTELAIVGSTQLASLNPLTPHNLDHTAAFLARIVLPMAPMSPLPNTLAFNVYPYHYNNTAIEASTANTFTHFTSTTSGFYIGGLYETQTAFDPLLLHVDDNGTLLNSYGITSPTPISISNFQYDFITSIHHDGLNNNLIFTGGIQERALLSQPFVPFDRYNSLYLRPTLSIFNLSSNAISRSRYDAINTFPNKSWYSHSVYDQNL